MQTSVDRIGADTAKRMTPDFSPGQELSARLAQRGLGPGDIDRIMLSHLHFDHVGGNQEVPDARVVVHQAQFASLPTDGIV